MFLLKSDQTTIMTGIDILQNNAVVISTSLITEPSFPYYVALRDVPC